MNKLRNFLIKLAMPKGYVILTVPESEYYPDEQYGRYYIQMSDGLRLYFEDGKYVGFSTQSPYIGKKKEDVRS